MRINTDFLDRVIYLSNQNSMFSWRTARCCANAAYLAYGSPSLVNSIVTDRWKFPSCEFISNDNTQAFVIANDEHILTAFRGTEPDSLKDWKTDLDLDLVKGQVHGQVHKGFYESLEEVWSDVHATIEKFREGKEKRLWFTGHSLGAALATLAVARMRYDGLPVDGLYTFGQPLVGDQKFANAFDGDFKAQTFRFVNNNDAVTRVPPGFFKYHHVGNLCYFDEEGLYRANISKWNQFIDRVKGRINDLFEIGTDGIKDHSMEDYLKRVRANAMANDSPLMEIADTTKAA